MATRIFECLLRHSNIRILLLVCACLVLDISPATAGVDAAETGAAPIAKSTSQLWLNPGFYSYHFQKERSLNNRNFGVGVEYRFSPANSVTVGAFENSDNQTSHYLGWYWLPVELGRIRIGAVLGAIDGYPRMLDGGWFLAAIPTASIEYGNVGMNLLFMPSFQDRLYGALSFQLKFRIR